MSLSKIVITYSASIKELENQMGLIFARTDAKPEKNFTSGTNANIQAVDQILVMHTADKRTKEGH